MKAFDRCVVISTVMLIWSGCLLKLVSLTGDVGAQTVLVAALVLATLNTAHKLTKSSKGTAYLGVAILWCLLPYAPLRSMGVTHMGITMSWVIDVTGVLGVVLTAQILDSLLTGGVFDKDGEA